MKIRTWPCYTLCIFLGILGINSGNPVVLAMSIIAGFAPAIIPST